jgi:glutathione S-transferase
VGQPAAERIQVETGRALTLRKLQSQGVHHITLVGADRQTSIEFWEGLLGMPFVFEQPNLDNTADSHLYFDPGDRRLITVFTNEDRPPDPNRTSTDVGTFHHLAFAVSQSTFRMTEHRRTHTIGSGKSEDQMAENTLSILTPSVNNLTVRILVRTAGLDCEERDVWGKKDEPAFIERDPAQLTPLLEEEGLPNGSMWESCAIMVYLCEKHGLHDLYPEDIGERAMINSAMFYLVGTLYPYLARATYPVLGFPQYPGEVATAPGADDAMKARAREDAEAALAQPLEAFHSFFIGGKQFIGGDRPSIADIRLAATLEFLRAIDYDFPAWAEEYMSSVEAALGDAYSEPAGDVWGYIASVKAPA